MRRLLASWWVVFFASLASVSVIPAFGNIVDLKITKSFYDQDAIRTAIDMFKRRYRRIPSSVEGLAALDPQFLKRVSHDPWRNPYLYRVSNDESYVLYSVGADCRDEYGAGDDVTSREKEYECATYGVDCAPDVPTSVALSLLLSSGLVGLARGIGRLRGWRSRNGGAEA
jgi:hypothetical protein